MIGTSVRPGPGRVRLGAAAFELFAGPARVSESITIMDPSPGAAAAPTSAASCRPGCRSKDLRVRVQVTASGGGAAAPTLRVDLNLKD